MSITDSNFRFDPVAAFDAKNAEIESLRQQLESAIAENQQLRTNAQRVFEQEERKRDQAIAAVIFGKK
jgi:regulator of replication initiation timing